MATVFFNKEWYISIGNYIEEAYIFKPKYGAAPSITGLFPIEKLLKTIQFKNIIFYISIKELESLAPDTIKYYKKYYKKTYYGDRFFYAFNDEVLHGYDILHTLGNDERYINYLNEIIDLYYRKRHYDNINI